MTPLLSIGEMAKKSQLSIQRLRYYDKIGLLVPAFTDSVSGYRYYEVAQEEQLNFIQALQYMGFSLKAIKQYLDKNTPESLPELLIKYQQKLQEDEARIARKKWLLNRFQLLLKRKPEKSQSVKTTRLILTEPLQMPIHSTILNDPLFHQEVQALINRLNLSKSYSQFPGYLMLDGERSLQTSERKPFCLPQNWELKSESENYLLQETVAWVDKELVHGYSYETNLYFE